MSSAVAELDNYLQSMLTLKAPGVSGSKINSITSLCTANVQNESVLIQKIYTHFKKAPGTHKLGVLYVVDSVTRQWLDAARKAGQPSGSAAPDGTFAAGVNRVTELLPVLMTDIINNAPEDQKVRSRCIRAKYPFPPDCGHIHKADKTRRFTFSRAADYKTLIYVYPAIHPLNLHRNRAS
jgi:protein NRD1